MNQQILKITADMRLQESRSIARAANSFPLKPDSVLEGLLDDSNNIPAAFPQTVQQLRNLPDANVKALLTAYHLPLTGSAAARKQRLCLLIGVQ
jgi:hypothetical protein